MLWLLTGVQYLVVAPAVPLAFWTDAPGAALWPWLSLLVVAIAVTVLVRMGQGGSRLRRESGRQPPLGDRTPDRAWKWGLVYYNPDGPALIVEKRFGVGYTFNFGNRWSWALLAVLLLPAVFAVTLG